MHLFIKEQRFVQPDLLPLEITKGELRQLSEFDPDDVIRTSILQESGKRFSFLFNEILIGLALTPIIVGFLYTFIIIPTVGSSIQLGIILLIVVPIIVGIGRWLWRKKTFPEALASLLEEIDKYHAVIKAIDISDQLEDSGIATESLTERTKVIAALQLIREDLVKALKTEKILRTHKNLLSANSQMFTTNLVSLKAMQVNTQASEYGQMLKEALQIGLSVQAEMRKLQGQNLPEK